MGYTTHCRTGILAHRPAAIQVDYLGFPGTIGAPLMWITSSPIPPC
jgi:protein O-GlcNAc transferase